MFQEVKQCKATQDIVPFNHKNRLLRYFTFSCSVCSCFFFFLNSFFVEMCVSIDDECIELKYCNCREKQQKTYRGFRYNLHSFCTINKFPSACRISPRTEKKWRWKTISVQCLLFQWWSNDLFITLCYGALLLFHSHHHKTIHEYQLGCFDFFGQKAFHLIHCTNAQKTIACYNCNRVN